MNMIKIFKALSNETRLQILLWLKEPTRYFSSSLCDSKGVDLKKMGVCVGLIQQKSGLSQSTTSEYLALLQDAGLVKASRVGQWTYYKRDEEAIAEFLKLAHKNL